LHGAYHAFRFVNARPTLRPCLTNPPEGIMADSTARFSNWFQIISNVAIIFGLGLVVYELNQSKQLASAQFITDSMARETIRTTTTVRPTSCCWRTNDHDRSNRICVVLVHDGTGGCEAGRYALA
jgi:hypothetical protein